VRHRDKPEVVHGESQERVAVRAGLLAEAVVVSTADRERFARIALSFVAEPGDPALGSLLNDCGPAEAFSAICDGHPPPMAGSARIPGLGRAIERWAARLDRVPTDSKLAAWERAGIRVLIPGDPEWPPQVDVLDAARPLVLWLRGHADLRFACLRSVSVVGARAASGYGNHVATEMAGALAERGWVVISGGPYSTKTPQARNSGTSAKGHPAR
jgi:DNA processing protein